MRAWIAAAAWLTCVAAEAARCATVGRVHGCLADGRAAATDIAPTRRRDVVVLVHGFPDTAASWTNVSGLLAERGCAVWTLTLPGYDPDMPPAEEDDAYYASRLAGDVAAFVEAVCVPGVDAVHLVGHDWGAALAYLARGSRCLRSLALLSVPPLGGLLGAALTHPAQLLRSWYMLFFQLPLLPELALRTEAFVGFLWGRWSPSLDLHGSPGAAPLRAATDALLPSDVRHAALAYYRRNVPALLHAWLPELAHAAPAAAAATYRLAHTAPEVPVLGVTGAEDGCIGTHVFEAAWDSVAQRLPAGSRLERLHGAGHFVQVEQPAQLAATLDAWMLGLAAPGP